KYFIYRPGQPLYFLFPVMSEKRLRSALCATLTSRNSEDTYLYCIINLFMKTIFYTFLIAFCLLLSCKKSEKNNHYNTANTKVKSVLYGRDSVAPLCYPCDPIITQKSEGFVYDNLDRLRTRFLITSTLSNNPIRIDTTETFAYSYSDNSSLIAGYVDQITGSIPINHILLYDLQKRLLTDSVTNPQVSNNKVSYFSYLQDTIIEFEKQTFPIGTQVKIDTMVLSGSNILQEKINSSLSFTELSYTITSDRNPFSYINNFSILASDYKNGSNSDLFSIYTPQNITYNIASQTLVKYWNGSSPITQYTVMLATTLDSLGRVNSISNRSRRDKKTTFSYY
ncbi:MAG: hypothetical protein ABIU77_24325, partial [Ferruginibacter sp.]